MTSSRSASSRELIYVVGGRQKPETTEKTKEWHAWGGAVIVEVDPVAGTARQVVDYVSPPEVCADDPSVVFKAGTLAGDVLHVPTQTELLAYSVPDFKQVGYVSLPRLNDVHHVRPTSHGTLLVANTGLDSVVEVTTRGEVCREWSTIGEEIWKRFDPTVDYRRVETTKPHHSHPNYVFEAQGEIWVSRFNQRDAFCLTRPEWRIPLGVAGNHDGEVVGDRVYCTSVDAHVMIGNTRTREKERDVDLNASAGVDMPLGWCRGLAVLDGDYAVVGFSRLRPTRFQENLRWVKHKLGSSGVGIAPTRIAVFDLAKNALRWEMSLEPFEMNIIFSIHPTTAAFAGAPWL